MTAIINRRSITGTRLAGAPHFTRDAAAPAPVLLTAAGRPAFAGRTRAPAATPPRGLPQHLVRQTASAQFTKPNKVHANSSPPHLPLYPTSRQKQKRGWRGPSGTGGRACTPKASKGRLAFVVPLAWASLSGAAAARQQGALRKRALPHPRPRRRDPQTHPGACHRPGLVGCGRPVAPQYVTPSAQGARRKKQAPGWEPGPGRQGAAKPDSLPGTPVRRAAFLPGRACPPLAICKPRRNQERKGANRAPLHPRGCWRTATQKNKTR